MTEKALKPLAVWDRERWAWWIDHDRGGSDSRLNGIACPTCGAELADTRPLVTLMSNPPQKNVNCTACGYVGYRIV